MNTRWTRPAQLVAFFLSLAVVLGAVLVLLLPEGEAATGAQVGTPTPTLPAGQCVEPYVYVTHWAATYGSADGQLSEPRGIAVDAAGVVYVADTSNHRIQKFTSGGVFLAKWGFQGSGDGEFNGPVDVDLDGAGNVYVVDHYNHRIQKFTSGGAFITKWGSQGSSDGQFNYPDGVAVDAAGSVYVADRTNNRIQKFTSTGGFLDKWGTVGSGNGQFLWPIGLAVDSAGTVYVADYLNSRIQRLDPSGNFLPTWGTPGTGDGEFKGPSGVAFDSAGNVFVADSGNNRIQKFTSGGVFLAKWNGSGSPGGQLNLPWKLAVDSAGTVYVADTFNHRVQVFAPCATVVTPGTIIIIKDAVPDDPLQVFTFTGDLGSFTLQDPSSTFPNTRTFSSLPPGTYTVTETALPGWYFGSPPDNVCTYPDGTTVTFPSVTATINLAAGATVTCRFINYKAGRIIVKKVTVPPGDPTSFQFTATFPPIAWSLTHGGSIDSGPLNPVSTYRVGETPVSGWTTTATCDNGSPVDKIDVHGAATVTCTFTNKKEVPPTGTIIIIKDAVPDDSQVFTFTTGVTGSGTWGPFSLQDPSSTFPNTQTFPNLPPGTYPVTETGILGWVTSVACKDPDGGTTVGGATAKIDLDAGETVTCTFTNKKPPKPPPTTYIYSAKIVCGTVRPPRPKPDIPTLRDPSPVVPGLYRTAVNVHNFWDEATAFQQKVAIALPQDQPRGPVTRRVEAKLGPNEALEVDCFNIVAILATLEGTTLARAEFLKGFLVIESPVELEVTAVYTAEELQENGISIDVERIQPHVRRSKGPTAIQPPAGLVSWWPGDRNANDIIDANHGTLQNGATFAAGKVGQAFSFDGLDDFVQVADNANLDPGTGSFTIDAWVKTTKATGTQSVVSKYECGQICISVVGSSLYWLTIIDGKLSGHIRDTNLGGPPGPPHEEGQAILGAMFIADGNLHHIAMVRDMARNMLCLYVDGVLDASAGLNKGADGAIKDDDGDPDPFLIGAKLVGGQMTKEWFFSGLIDEVEFFNRALSAAEIKALFDAGSAGKKKP